MIALNGKLSPAEKRETLKLIRQWADSVVEEARECLLTDGVVQVKAERPAVETVTGGPFRQWEPGPEMVVTFRLRKGPKRKRGAK